MRKFRIMLFLSTACWFVLSGCGGGGDGDQGVRENNERRSSDEAELRTVVHEFGEQEIPANPQRIVSINLEDMLLALDVPMVMASPAGRQDYLNEALEQRGTKVVPLGEGIPYEAVLQAEPDLIIASRVFDQQDFEQLNKIAPTIAFDRADWRNSIVKIGEALQLEEQAEAVLTEHAQKIEEAREQIAGLIGTEKTAAFLRIQEKDLRLFFPGIESDPNPYAGYVSIAYAGLSFQADPVALQLQKDHPDRQNAPVSLEVLPELEADYLFIVALSADGGDEALQRTYDELEELQTSPIWSTIPAVQAGEVYILNMKNWLIDGPHAESLKINELLEVLER